MTTSGIQRRQAILAEAYEAGHIGVKEIAGKLGVSEATVRRDLHTLAESGELELTHGGAFVSKTGDYSFHAKARRNVDAKRLIGRLAAEMVVGGEQVFADSGTTCFEMAPYFRRKRGLSIIVNSVRLAEELNAPGLNVILLGGQYRPDRMDIIGPVATGVLEQFHGYLAFIGTDGLGMDFGPTASDIESANLNRLAVRNARQTVLLADHSKFRAASLCRIVEWKSISRVVTDLPPEPEWDEFFRSRSIEVIFPRVDAATPDATS